jgi:hypothetical protein
MNFPMGLPFFQFLYWLVNSPGIGGVLLVLLTGGVVFAFVQVLHWVSQGGQAKENETYSYPTPALHQEGHPARK